MNITPKPYFPEGSTPSCEPKRRATTSSDDAQRPGSPAPSIDLGAASALAVAARALVAAGVVDDALPLLDRLVRVLGAAHEADTRAVADGAIDRALGR